MKKTNSFLILAFALFLFGCLTVEQTVKFSRDGSAEISGKIDVSKLRTSIQSDNFDFTDPQILADWRGALTVINPRNANATVDQLQQVLPGFSSELGEGLSDANLSNYCNNASSLGVDTISECTANGGVLSYKGTKKAKTAEWRTETTTIFNFFETVTNKSYALEQESIPLSYTIKSEQLQQFKEKGVNIEINVEMPGEIYETSGKLEDNTAIFDLDFMASKQKLVVKSNEISKELNITNIFGLILAIVLIAGLGYYFFIMKRKLNQ